MRDYIEVDGEYLLNTPAWTEGDPVHAIVLTTMLFMADEMGHVFCATGRIARSASVSEDVAAKVIYDMMRWGMLVQHATSIEILNFRDGKYPAEA